MDRTPLVRTWKWPVYIIKTNALPEVSPSFRFIAAQGLLRQAEDYQRRKQYKPAAMTAREAVQTAEDSRLIAFRRIEAERQEMERAAAADREAKAKAEAEESARQQALAEEQQRLEAQRRAQAEQTAAQARADMAAAERAKAEAEAARQAALAQQQQAPESPPG
jgi:hypothetical protein